MTKLLIARCGKILPTIRNSTREKAKPGQTNPIQAKPIHPGMHGATTTGWTVYFSKPSIFFVFAETRVCDGRACLGGLVCLFVCLFTCLLLLVHICNPRGSRLSPFLTDRGPTTPAAARRSSLLLLGGVFSTEPTDPHEGGAILAVVSPSNSVIFRRFDGGKQGQRWKAVRERERGWGGIG